MVFAIDETVDCYVCNWKGHEDDVKLVERPDLARGEDGTQDILDAKLGFVALAFVAYEGFMNIPHLPTAFAWLGICFAVFGASIGALIARHENDLEKG